MILEIIEIIPIPNKVIGDALGSGSASRTYILIKL